MNVVLLKDLANVGFAGQIVKVREGYARNFLFPKKLAIVATEAHKKNYSKLQKKLGVEELEHGVRIASLAEAITKLNINLKKKVNDKGRLYGAFNAEDIVDLLKSKNIVITKKQVEFDKAIRSTGDYHVTIRLSSKLKPVMKITIQELKEEK